jgi:hypothetical protein
MFQWGVWCLIIGVGAALLPMTGRQFVILAWAGDYAPAVGGVIALLGAGLITGSFFSKNNA